MTGFLGEEAQIGELVAHICYISMVFVRSVGLLGGHQGVWGIRKICFYMFGVRQDVWEVVYMLGDLGDCV